MARVSLPDGREVDVPDGDTLLLDYYRGEGGTVEVDEQAVVTQFPQVFDGEKYVDAAPEVAEAEVAAVEAAEVEQLPDGEAVEVDTSVEQEHPGFGEPSDGVEAPADGTPVEVSNDDAAEAPHPSPGPAPVAE